MYKSEKITGIEIPFMENYDDEYLQTHAHIPIRFSVWPNRIPYQSSGYGTYENNFNNLSREKYLELKVAKLNTNQSSLSIHLDVDYLDNNLQFITLASKDIVIDDWGERVVREDSPLYYTFDRIPITGIAPSMERSSISPINGVISNSNPVCPSTSVLPSSVSGTEKKIIVYKYSSGNVSGLVASSFKQYSNPEGYRITTAKEITHNNVDLNTLKENMGTYMFMSKFQVAGYRQEGSYQIISSIVGNNWVRCTSAKDLGNCLEELTLEFASSLQESTNSKMVIYTNSIASYTVGETGPLIGKNVVYGRVNVSIPYNSTFTWKASINGIKNQP